MNMEPAADTASDTPSDAQGEVGHASGLSRRGLLGLAGAAGLVAGGAFGVAGGVAIGRAADAAPGDGPVTHPFFGEHQSGVSTAVQDHVHFAAFDMMARTDRADLISLLQDWTYAASRMTQGLEVSASGAVGGSPQAPPDDTGEALGLDASHLTVTIGFGPTLFVLDGVDRFGIAAQQPASLQRLPAFLGDDIDPTASDGDLCIQVCADDPQVAVHAIRNLSRIAFGRARIRWSQLGFGRTSKTTAAQQTPRNLFGFKDGTANILAEDAEALRDQVWVGASDQPGWMHGGTYLVARKIAMLIESWDRVRLEEQERIIGRSKGAGAALSDDAGDEFAAPDFTAKDAGGQPRIDAASHVRLAHPDMNNGTRLLRRGFNYVDGNNDLGRLSAGLFFLSYQRAPEQFIDIQRALSTDVLNEYIRHVGSGIWAIPPGVEAGSYVGASLFA